MTLTVERSVEPTPQTVPVAAITNGDRTAALVVPLAGAGGTATLESGAYRLRFRLDRARYRTSAADPDARLQQEASIDIEL